MYRKFIATLASVSLAWFCYVAPLDHSKPWSKYEYNSKFGCQDWLGGINQHTRSHPNGYAGKYGVGLGGDGVEGGSCKADAKDVNGDSWWSFEFYPDNINGAYKYGYQELGTCRAVLRAVNRRHTIHLHHKLLTGHFSADCIFNGDTNE